MRKLIARNAHAITRCVRVIRVGKSTHLNESEQNYAYFSTRVTVAQATALAAAKLACCLSLNRHRLFGTLWIQAGRDWAKTSEER